jgi:hypothetical protein
MRLIDEISFFLKENGFESSVLLRHGFDVICTRTAGREEERIILPLEIGSATEEEAARAGEEASECIRFIRSSEGYPLIITEDRWHRQKEMTQARLLAHLEVFTAAYARNCEIRRIEKAEAQEFLNAHHSYGYAACRYHYGLFLKRHTGHTRNDIPPGTLIAVATFSNARKWQKGDRYIRSYEWTRYASLPHLRISGGMGRLLKAFIEEVKPDDIMSYADLEWSEGEVYRNLGFRPEPGKDPVMFLIDSETWGRIPVKPGIKEGNLYFRNFGSNKYRLKLTDYE